MSMLNNTTKTLRVEWRRGTANTETKDVVIASTNNPQDMIEAKIKDVFQIKTHMTFFEDTKTYSYKPSTLYLYEIENGKQIACIGKTILDLSNYISMIDQ